MCDTFTGRLERGAGRAPIERLPYFAEMVASELQGGEAPRARGHASAGLVLRVSGQAQLPRAGRLPGARARRAGRRRARCARAACATRSARARRAARGAATRAAGRAQRRDRRQDAWPKRSPHCLPEGAIVADEGNTEGFLVSLFCAGRAAARLAVEHRRLDRPRPAARDRRRRRLPRSQGDLPAGRRQRDVHACKRCGRRRARA